MQIVVVHQYYLVPGQPGGSRFNEMARFWAEAGHDVTVIAGNLNYATGHVHEGSRGRWITTEYDGKVKVLRCYVPRTYTSGIVGRANAFAGFMLSAATAALRIPRPDVVIATSPPLTAAIPGWIAARARWHGVPWIFEIRDLWPESAVTTGVLSAKGPLTRALYGLEWLACKSAERINVLTPAFREDLLRRHLAPDARIVFVPNGADVSRFQPGPRDNDVRRAFGWGDRFVVMYAGAHGRANALGQLLDAAERLVDRPDIHIALVGDGPERANLEAMRARRGIKNLTLHGPQGKEQMPDVVNACDVGAAVLQNNPTFRTVYPNKVFDYMACERATLLGIDGTARKLVCDEAQAGLFVRPEDPDDIAAGIRHLADHAEECSAMGKRGRAWVLANATREALAARYLAVMEDVVAESR